MRRGSSVCQLPAAPGCQLSSACCDVPAGRRTRPEGPGRQKNNNQPKAAPASSGQCSPAGDRPLKVCVLSFGFATMAVKAPCELARTCRFELQRELLENPHHMRPSFTACLQHVYELGYETLHDAPLHVMIAAPSEVGWPVGASSVTHTCGATTTCLSWSTAQTRRPSGGHTGAPRCSGTQVRASALVALLCGPMLLGPELGHRCSSCCLGDCLAADKNPDNKEAEARFIEVQAAYDVLSDKHERSWCGVRFAIRCLPVAGACKPCDAAVGRSSDSFGNWGDASALPAKLIAGSAQTCVTKWMRAQPPAAARVCQAPIFYSSTCHFCRAGMTATATRFCGAAPRRRRPGTRPRPGARRQTSPTCTPSSQHPASPATATGPRRAREQALQRARALICANRGCISDQAPARGAVGARDSSGSTCLGTSPSALQQVAGYCVHQYFFTCSAQLGLLAQQEAAARAPSSQRAGHARQGFCAVYRALFAVLAEQAAAACAFQTISKCWPCAPGLIHRVQRDLCSAGGAGGARICVFLDPNPDPNPDQLLAMRARASTLCTARSLRRWRSRRRPRVRAAAAAAPTTRRRPALAAPARTGTACWPSTRTGRASPPPRTLPGRTSTTRAPRPTARRAHAVASGGVSLA